MSTSLKLISALWNAKVEASKVIFLCSRLLAVMFVLAGYLAISDVAAAVSPPSHVGKTKKHRRTEAVSKRQVLGGGSSFDQRTVPVFWQTTRSRFLSSGPSTQTESYRETWMLQPRDEATAWLVSPRGRAVVYGANLLDGGLKNLAALVIGERDLARMVGIPLTESGSEDETAEGSPFHLVPMAGSKSGETLVLKSSDDEHFSVQFEMGHSGG